MRGPWRPDARIKLDRVRELLGATVAGPTCGFCGAPDRHGQHTPCPVCGGKIVNAQNVIRAIAETICPTTARFVPEVHRRGEERRAGQVEAMAPMLSGRTFTGNED